MDLVDAFPVRAGDLVTIIGGGGKTSLMFALATELVRRGQGVVTTTTTKMLLPPPSQGGRLLLARDVAGLRKTLSLRLPCEQHVTVGLDLGRGTVGSVPGETARWIRDAGLARCVVVEGDGCRHRHLKAPRPNEPVIPPSTDLVVPVVGIDLVGKTFTGETVFRPEIVESITPFRRGDRITVEMIYSVLFHPRGVISRTPPGSRVVPFVSFVDGPEDLVHARALAHRALREQPFGIERMVLGNADPGRVAQVLTAAGPEGGAAGDGSLNATGRP